MKYLIILLVVVSQVAMSRVNLREFDLLMLLSYRTHQLKVDADKEFLDLRIITLQYARSFGCFDVIKKTRREEKHYRNCKFLLKDIPEDLRDENIPENNVVDFERSDENPESETNIIKHINIKRNGDIVFLYERGSGAKTSLYFCTQKLNIEDEGLAENPIPECEFLHEVEYQDDINAHFKPVYIEKIDQFYPAR